MLLALVGHGATVIPVEVVQIGVIGVGLFAGVGCATSIFTPWGTLGGRRGNGVALCR